MNDENLRRDLFSAVSPPQSPGDEQDKPGKRPSQPNYHLVFDDEIDVSGPHDMALANRYALHLLYQLEEGQDGPRRLAKRARKVSRVRRYLHCPGPTQNAGVGEGGVCTPGGFADAGRPAQRAAIYSLCVLHAAQDHPRHLGRPGADGFCRRPGVRARHG